MEEKLHDGNYLFMNEKREIDSIYVVDGKIVKPTPSNESDESAQGVTMTFNISSE